MKHLTRILFMALLVAAACLGSERERPAWIRCRCDGAATTFAFPFRIAASSEVKVVLMNVATDPYTATLLTESRDYVVTVLNDSYPADGGTITTTSAYNSDCYLIVTTRAGSGSADIPATPGGPLDETVLPAVQTGARIPARGGTSEIPGVDAAMPLPRYITSGSFYRVDGAGPFLGSALGFVAPAADSPAIPPVQRGPVSAMSTSGNPSGWYDVTASPYNAKGDGVTDDTNAIMQAVKDAWAARGGTIYFPPGTYRCQLTLDKVYAYNATVANASVTFLGASPWGSRLMANQDNAYAVAITGTSGWETPFVFRNLCFDGDQVRCGGVYCNASGVSNLRFDDCVFWKCTYGFRNVGTLYYVFTHCTFCRNDFGVHLTALHTMHGGCGWFYWCNWYINSKAAVYVNGKDPSASPAAPGILSQLQFWHSVNEGNPGFAFFLKKLGPSRPTVIGDCWFELNATASSVQIDGVTYEPNDILLDDAGYVQIRDCSLGRIGIVSRTRLETFDCYSYGTGTQRNMTYAAADPNIVIQHHRLTLDQSYACNQYCDVAMPLSLGNRVVSWLGKQTDAVTWSHTNLLSNGSMTVPFTPSSANDSAWKFESRPDAPLWGRCLTVNLKPNLARATEGFGLWRTASEIKAGRWYVWSLDARSDVDAYLSLITAGSTGTAGNNAMNSQKMQVVSRQWRRFWGMRRAPGTGSWTHLYLWNSGSTSANYYLCNFQLVEFASIDEAVRFVEEGAYAAGPEIPRPRQGTVALTADYNVVAATDNGTRFTNESAVPGPILVRLPSATVGQRYSFTTVRPNDIEIDPQPTNAFRGHPQGTHLKLAAQGASVTIECLELAAWDITAAHDPTPATPALRWEP
jgi:hypothetical protein